MTVTDGVVIGMERPRGTPPVLVLRSAHAADAEAITEIVNLPGFQIANTRGPFLPAGEMLRMIDGLAPHDRVIVAVVEGKVVGFVVFNRLVGRRAHVGTLGMGVHDDWTGRGIGGALLSAVIDMADNWFALRRLELDVATDNDAAIRLYTRFGFETEGVRRGQEFRNGRYVDHQIMARVHVSDTVP